MKRCLNLIIMLVVCLVCLTGCGKSETEKFIDYLEDNGFAYYEDSYYKGSIDGHTVLINIQKNETVIVMGLSGELDLYLFYNCTKDEYYVSYEYGSFYAVYYEKSSNCVGNLCGTGFNNYYQYFIDNSTFIRSFIQDSEIDFSKIENIDTNTNKA